MTTGRACIGSASIAVGRVGSIVVETLTWVVELGVGAACLVLSWAMRGATRWRWLMAALTLAGAAAVIHAVGALAGAWS